jgi:DNA-binding transcriptional ArsR family regulator
MGENEDETLAISDKVEILSTEDEKIKAVGEILSSDSSRKILKLLFNQSLTANQISQKTDVSLPLVIYHLKKMQDSGVIKITNIGKNTKSHDMKFYTVDKFAIVILPSEMSQSAKTSKSLFNSFSRIHRLATLGALCVAAWFSSQFIQKTSQIPILMEDELAIRGSEETTMMQKSAPTSESLEAASTPAITTGEPSLDLLWSFVIVLLVVVAGLTIELLIKNKKEKTKNLTN